MKLPKFISSIRSRPSSGASTPISSPRSSLSSPKFSPRSLGSQLSPRKSVSFPEVLSGPLEQFSPRNKRHSGLGLPSLRGRRGEQTSEIVEQGQDLNPIKELSTSEDSSVHARNGSSPSSSAAPISAGLRQEFEITFNHFDTNRDGKISAAELGEVLRSLGDEVSHEEAIQMVKMVDMDGDGFIDFEEFIDMNTKWIQNTGELDSIGELKAVFSIFDKDMNGYITAEELHAVLKNLGDKECTVDDCSRMIRGVDRNGDGLVDFEEFKSMMSTSVY